MELLLTYLGVVFVCGLIAWAVRLPPLIGFLAAGFALHAAGVEHVESLDLFADIGVTLMPVSYTHLTLPTILLV